MTAGLAQADRKLYDKEIREALAAEDLDFFGDLTRSLCAEMPERGQKILNSARYLEKFVSGISVCAKAPGANNGGCSEPHVSHVLSARLSSRPMAWSKRTLKQLAPVLAAGQAAFQIAKSPQSELPEPLKKTAVKANKAFRKYSAGLPHPNAIGTLPISGNINGTQKLLKLYA